MTSLYPLVMFFSLAVFRFPLRYLSIFIIVFAVIYLVIHVHQKKKSVIIFISPILLICIGIVCFFLDDDMVFKFYPVLANTAYLIIFGTSLLVPPPFVLSFVNLFVKSIRNTLPKKRLEQYCRRATAAWCVFFVLDGIAAFFTVFRVSDLVWGIYNGGITYAVMGIIFVCQITRFKGIAKQEKIQTEKNEEEATG
jgi:uncharacterized membrane protein